MESYFFREDTVRRPNQMSLQCRSEVEHIQLGSAHEKYSV